MAKKPKDVHSAFDFYTAIGRALTTWSSVENALCTVFCRCVGRENGFPANHAYWAVTSFDARLRMVDRSLTMLAPETHKVAKDWTELREKLAKGNRERNKIAHGTVTSMPYFDKQKNEQRDLFFAPYFWGNLAKNYRSGDFRPKDRMYVANISRATETFSGLEAEVDNMAK